MQLSHRSAAGRQQVRPASQSTICVWADGLHWSCLSGYQLPLFGAEGANWPDLDNEPRAVLVKANPQRRVYRIQQGDLTVYAKLHIAATLADRIKWRLRGVPSLTEFGHLQTTQLRSVPVAKPLAWAHGSIKGQVVAMLVTESLGEGVSLADLLWARPDGEPAKLSAAAYAAGVAVARMHCAGVEHLDLHPGNVLLLDSEDSTGQGPGMKGCITDLQNVRIEQRGGHASADPDRPWRRANVAVLLAAIRTAADMAAQRRFVQGYLQTMQPRANWTASKIDDYLQRLEPLADKHDRRIWRSRDRRAMRNSPYSRRIHLTDGWSARVFLRCKYPVWHCQASQYAFGCEDWEAALADPPGLVQPGESLKQGGHSTVVAKEISIGGTRLQIVAKHCRLGTGLRGLLQSVRPSRSIRQWRLANALVTRRIATAWPLAAIERKAGPLLQESIFLSERIPHSLNLLKMFQQPDQLPPPGPERNGLARQLGLTLAQLTRCSFAHRDCKASNIVIQNTSDPAQPWRVYLVDLDGLSLSRLPTALNGHRALVRLAASALPFEQITPRDYAAVFNSYVKNLHEPYSHNSLSRKRLWQKLSRRATRMAARKRP